MSSLVQMVNPGRGLKPIKLNKTTPLTELWEAYIRLKGDIAPATLDEAQRIARVFSEFMTGREINPESLSDWLIHQQNRTYTRGYGGAITKKLHPRYINARNTKIRHFLRWLHRVKVLPEDLSPCLPNISAPALPVPATFTFAEYERMKAFCAVRPHYQMYRWLIILGYRCGLSLVDCCHLRWCQVHLDPNGQSFLEVPRIKVRRHGAKTISRIPLIAGTDVYECLLSFKAHDFERYQRIDGINDYVHPDAAGYYDLRDSCIDVALRYIMKKTGIFGRSFRNFRNTFISNLINAGVNPVLVCKMSGHSDTTMLIHYLRPDQRALQDGLQSSFIYGEHTRTS